VAGAFAGKRHLIVVSTGALTSLPLQVLVSAPPPAAGTPAPEALREAAWLIKSYALSVLPSVQSLSALRRLAAGGAGTRPFFGMGDPVLQGPDPNDRQRGAKRRSASTPARFYRNGLADTRAVRELTPLPDTAQYLMDTYGLTAEQAGDGSPDVVWLLREKKGEARPYSSGDMLPFGADVFPGHKANDTVLWVESQRAVISGDTLVDFGRGLEINERWLRPGVTREEIAEGLRPLLALPVEHVLATHGGPTDRAALERALSFS
jgi:hypothetical protein